MTEHKFEVGQKVWVVPSDRRCANPREATVTKIGRKWCELNGGRERFDLSNERHALDGGQYASPGRVWLSQADHEAHVIRQQKWVAIHSRIKNAYTVPGELHDLHLDTLAAILGVDLSGFAPPAKGGADDRPEGVRSLARDDP